MLRDSLATSPRRTLAAAGACATLFAASFALGSATRDDEKRPAARPAQSASITEPAPAARQRAIQLGNAAALPPLRKPPRPRAVTPYVARVSKPAREAAVPASTDDDPAAPPAPVEQTPAPAAPAPPPAPAPQPTAPAPRPTASGPTPDRPPSQPQPAPDPAPSGGSAYTGEEE